VPKTCTKLGKIDHYQPTTRDWFL